MIVMLISLVLVILCRIRCQGKWLQGGSKVGWLFPLRFNSSNVYFACTNVPHQYDDWHRKLGDPNYVVLSHLIKKNELIRNKMVMSNYLIPCAIWKLGKSKTLHFSTHAHCATKCFEVVHSNGWGMSYISSHVKYKYFATYINHYNQFTWLYLFHYKA